MNTILRHKSNEEELRKFEKTPLHKVVWLKCPKCGENFWFSCFVDSLEEETEEARREFIEELGQICGGDKHRRGFI